MNLLRRAESRAKIEGRRQGGNLDTNTGTRQGISNTGDSRLEAAFPTLTDEHIQFLEPFGRRVKLKKGEKVWEAGVVDLCMYVVIEGEIDIVDGRSGDHVTTHKKGSFSGDIDILSGRSAIVTGVAGTDLELLEVPADCVRSIVGERPDVGEIILRAFLLRRALLIETLKSGLLVLGSRFCPETLRIREFLVRNRYPVVWEDLESNPNTARMLAEFHVTEQQTPIVVLPNGDVLRVPSNTQLAEALGSRRTTEDKLFDLVIVGAGPAGLAAAVYGASEGLSTLLLDSVGPGGQAGTSSKIENYMGFPLGISGQQLADGALIQAEKFGARIVVPAVVTKITCNGIGGHSLDIEGMATIETKCVILAPGAHYRKLEVENQDRYEGRGIYYAATNVERVMCGESTVAVVGAGNSAGQAAVFMSDNARHVFLIVRGDSLRKTMSSYLASRIERSDRITVLTNSEICAMEGDPSLESITIVDRSSGQYRSEAVSGIFVMIGAVPHTGWVPPEIVLDPKGFILTGQSVVQEGKWSLPRQPFLLETSCPGVFAVGDARANSVKRVASAVGEGSMAVAFVHQFLAM
jgi:thioredoxin reductase (NADPH)